MAQKPRATMADDLNTEGWPRVQDKLLAGTETSAAPQDPKAFWHMRQWQIPARPRVPAT